MNNWINIKEQEPLQNVMLLFKTNENIDNIATTGLTTYDIVPKQINLVLIGFINKNVIWTKNWTINGEHYYSPYYVPGYVKYRITHWKYYDDDNITSKNITIPPILKNQKFLDLD